MAANKKTTNTATTGEKKVIQISIAQAFNEDLKASQEASTKYRNSLMLALAAILAAYYSGYVDRTDSEREETAKILDKACSDAKIEASSFLLKLVKLAMTGDDAKLASARAHILQVAVAKKIRPDGFCQWVDDESGLQEIRVTYNRDGTPKKPKKPLTPGNEVALKFDTQSVANAHAKLRTKSLGRLSKDAVSNVKLPTVTADTPCTLYAVQHADGSMTIKAVVTDSDFMKRAAVYAADAPELVKQQSYDDALEEQAAALLA